MLVLWGFVDIIFCGGEHERMSFNIQLCSKLYKLFVIYILFDMYTSGAGCIFTSQVSGGGVCRPTIPLYRPGRTDQAESGIAGQVLYGRDDR